MKYVGNVLTLRGPPEQMEWDPPRLWTLMEQEQTHYFDNGGVSSSVLQCLGNISEKEGRVFTSVLLFVCQQDYVKNYRTDSPKFGGRMGHEPRKNLVWTKGQIQDFLEEDTAKGTEPTAAAGGPKPLHSKTYICNSNSSRGHELTLQVSSEAGVYNSSLLNILKKI